MNKFITFLLGSFAIVSCTNNSYNKSVLSPIENISYLFDFFIDQKKSNIIQNDSLFKVYNVSFTKDSVSNEGDFYKLILQNCIDNSYGNYIKITRKDLFDKFIQAHLNEILLDENLELTYQKNNSETYLFLVNKQNYLYLNTVVDFKKSTNDTLIFTIKDKELLKKYEVYQLEKPLFLIDENQIIAEPQQIKINYVNNSVKIIPLYSN